MNKIISMILLCALLLSCFAGCATPKAPADMNDPNDEVDPIPDDDKSEENSDNEIDSTPNDNENEENPDNEIDATPDDNAGEKNPDNEADPTPDDDTDDKEEKDPDHENNAEEDNKDLDDEDIEYVFVAVEGKGNIATKYITCVDVPSVYETSNAEIPITLYYGLLERTPVEIERYPEIVVRAMNGKEQAILINRLDSEDILKPEYNVKCVWDEERTWVVGFMFAHIQTLTLPLSLFSGESGVVHIVLQECANFDSDNVVFGSGGYVNLYYTRNETTISIRVERVV